MKKLQWKELVPVCFGKVDLEWGGNTLDAISCKAMLKAATQEGATVADVTEEARQYLSSKGATLQHIQKKVALLRILQVNTHQ